MTTEPTPDEIEQPVEETTEKHTTETHVEGDKVEVEVQPDGTRTITATDDPKGNADDR